MGGRRDLPVSSIVITEEEMVWVEAPAKAAAPHKAKEATWQLRPGWVGGWVGGWIDE